MANDFGAMATVPQGNPPDSSGPSPRSTPDSRVYLRLSRRWVALIALLIVAPWSLVGLIIARSISFHSSPPTQLTLGGTDVSVEAIDCRPGPWGELELTPILISPPLELVDSLDPSRIDNDWVFPEETRESLPILLQSLGLTAQQIDRMMASATQLPGQRMVVKPDESVRKELPTPVRAKLYNHLAGSESNLDQNNAFRFSGSIEAWFRDAKLDPATIELVAKYIYADGNLLFFADLPLVMKDISGDELLRLIKVLSREQTFLIKLRLASAEEIAPIAQYWGARGRLTDVEPILESIVESENDHTIDITHLLPPFARRRLYTYPQPRTDALSLGRDCHWTALNFFNEQPNDRFAGDDYHAVDLTGYQTVRDNPRFGDLVLFKHQMSHFHSAIYLADDLVYTKNGSKMSRPWMIMRIDDLLHYYPQFESPEVEYMRWSKTTSDSSS